MNPKIAETLVHSAEALRGRLIWCAGSEAVMTRAKLSVQCFFRGGDRGAQCSVGADRGHSIRTQWLVIPAIPCPSRYGADRGHSVTTQWPVIPAVPCPGRYGADATSGPVGHSVALSHRPAEIAGVVEALMRHDTLSGGSIEAGGDGLWTSRARATRRMRPRARRRIRLLAEASRERPRVIRRIHLLPRPSVESLGRGGDGVPCRGLP